MSKKILLADDSITIQKVIELTFSDEDFEVVTVGNGRLALEKLADTRPDMVLCDIMMPEKDGYEVCERIKQNPETAHIPVLLLTGAFEPFDQERAARAGSDGFLAKPFEPETLIAKVKELLARAPSRTSPPSLPPRADPPPPPAVAAPVAPPPMPRATPPVPPVPRAAPPSPPGVSSFLPEEPFDAFDAEAIEELGPEASAEPEASLAPVTPEESAALTGQAAPGDSAPADASSTVMFQPGDVPWEAPGGLTAPESAVSTARMAEPEPMVSSEPDAFLAPDSYAGSMDEGPSFEEVIEEEDAAFGAKSYVPEEPAEVDEASQTVMFEAEPEAPPSRDGASTGRFPSVSPSSPSAIETTPPLPKEQGAPPVRPSPPLSPPPPVGEALAASTAEESELPELEPDREARPPVETKAAPSRPSPHRVEETQAPVPPLQESFAGVAETAAPVAARSSSEAASVPVPVEMVEKIAQRVVAQVSEKIVREIAWDVIPDLAEALIKQEIERLKAELQKL